MTRNQTPFNQAIVLLSAAAGVVAYSASWMQAIAQPLSPIAPANSPPDFQQISQSFPDRGSPPKTTSGGSRGCKVANRQISLG